MPRKAKATKWLTIAGPFRDIPSERKLLDSCVKQLEGITFEVVETASGSKNVRRLRSECRESDAAEYYPRT